MNIPKHFYPHKDEFTIVDYFETHNLTTYEICEKKHFNYHLLLSDKISIRINEHFILIDNKHGDGFRCFVFPFSKEILEFIKQKLHEFWLDVNE